MVQRLILCAVLQQDVDCTAAREQLDGGCRRGLVSPLRLRLSMRRRASVHAARSHSHSSRSMVIGEH